MGQGCPNLERSRLSLVCEDSSEAFCSLPQLLNTLQEVSMPEKFCSFQTPSSLAHAFSTRTIYQESVLPNTGCFRSAAGSRVPAYYAPSYKIGRASCKVR